MSESCVAVDLVCEYLANPLGLGEREPRLSWRLDDPRPGARQTGYRVVAASSPARLDKRPDLWDSGRVAGSQTLDVVYAGKPLRSRQAVWWKVLVWDHVGREGAWSAPACFELGLLRKADWQAQWIGRPDDRGQGGRPSPYLRRGFELAGEVRSARLHATALGIFELHLNGRRVGDEVFTPGWTDYHKRIQVMTYDVTALLRSGANALGAVLADGWYAGFLGWAKHRNCYGSQLGLLEIGRAHV